MKTTNRIEKTLTSVTIIFGLRNWAATLAQKDQLKMKFCTLNKFNVIMNFASGNLFPLTGEDTGLIGFPSTAYFIFVWLFQISSVLMTITGLLFFAPPLEALQSGGVVVIVYFEVICLSVHLNSQRENLRNLVRTIDSILIESDDLKRCVLQAVEPPMERLKLYTVVNLISSIVWESQVIVKVLSFNEFKYTDFTVPTYFPGAPFTINVFFFVVFIRTVSSTYLMSKKIGIDIYVSYCITLLTAEYRYIQEKMAAALREKNEILVINSLKACVERHCVAIEIGHTLTEIMSVNVGLAYFNSILRFCFAAFSLIRLTAYFEKCLYVTFTIGSLIQVYMFCWCIQELLEASTSVTEKAFHENWYGRGRTILSIFHTIVIGDQMECRLTAFRVIDLSVPTFATILKQAYSACLLLLKI